MSLTDTDVIRPRFVGAVPSTVSEIGAVGFFLGLPRGRFSGCGISFSELLIEDAFFLPRLAGTGSTVSKTDVTEPFLGCPFGRDGEAVWLAHDVDMAAWAVLFPSVVLFRLSQHWVSSATIAVRFFTTLKPYDATSLARRASE